MNSRAGVNLSPLHFKTRKTSHIVPVNRFDAPRAQASNFMNETATVESWRFSPHMTIEDWTNTMPSKQMNTLTPLFQTNSSFRAEFSQTAPDGFNLKDKQMLHHQDS